MTTFQEILDALYGDQVLQLTEDAVVGHPLAQIVAENLIAAQNREANWPAAALADPPEFPFEFDRHTYTADTDRAWRERNGLA